MRLKAHAFDARGQLVASVASVRAGEATAPDNHHSAWAEQAVWRYAYDAQQRRVLAQQGDSGQGVASQSETAATERSSFEGDSARLTLPEQSAYNANGQPARWGKRGYPQAVRTDNVLNASGVPTNGNSISYRSDQTDRRKTKSSEQSQRRGSAAQGCLG